MLLEKLDVLMAADIIDEETKEYILNVLDFLRKELKINDLEKIEIFLIHLAMADSRRKKKENLDAKMEDIIREEVRNHSNFQNIKEKWFLISNILGEKNFMENELDFIYLHLLNVIEGEKNVS